LNHPDEQLEAPPVIARRGWWVHLLVLTAYPLFIGLVGLMGSPGQETGLPATRSGLLLVSAMELGLFTLIFLVAWLFSRASSEQLYLKWRGGPAPIFRGLVYSIALRIMIGLFVAAILAVAIAIFGMEHDLLEKVRPRIEAVVNPEALREDPIYFAMTLTIISFVVAGLREELWRAGMLAGLLVLFPKAFAGTRGGLLAAGLIAVVFGLGHTLQGWGAIGMVTLLGFGLGAIIIYHRSIWEAVMAHGFFNATSFLLVQLWT
jgi:membrane protease YdiL (CAAX protease family)